MSAKSRRTSAHIKLTVNDEVLMDGSLGQWKHQDPTAFQHMLQPGREPAPYMKAALMAVMEAVATNSNTHIDVHTEPQGWTLRVTHLAPKAGVA